MTRNQYNQLNTSAEAGLPSESNNLSAVNTSEIPVSAAEVEIELGNRNTGIAAIDPARLERITNRLTHTPVGRGQNENPDYRIDTIMRSTKSVIENLYYFDDKSVEQLIGLVNFTFKGDDSVFANNILPNRADYNVLEAHVINGNIAHILGSARPEGRDIAALDLEDRVYLFAKSLKELLSDNEWQQSSGTNLTAEQLNQVQNSIDEGVEYVTNPSAYRTFIACLQSPQVQNFLAPALSRINYARENPASAAANLLAMGTSIAWGVQEGAPVDFQVTDNGINQFVVVFANAAIFAGLSDSGTLFVNEVREALSENNPLGRRMVQLGAIALGAYLVNQNNEESIGASEEALSMIGVAMAGISAVVALERFSNRALPVVSSGIREFPQLVSNAFGNLFPANNVEGAQVQAVVPQQNDIEIV